MALIRSSFEIKCMGINEQHLQLLRQQQEQERPQEQFLTGPQILDYIEELSEDKRNLLNEINVLQESIEQRKTSIRALQENLFLLDNQIKKVQQLVNKEKEKKLSKRKENTEEKNLDLSPRETIAPTISPMGKLLASLIQEYERLTNTVSALQEEQEEAKTILENKNKELEDIDYDLNMLREAVSEEEESEE
jgi:chromosome segregation ATPase